MDLNLVSLDLSKRRDGSGGLVGNGRLDHQRFGRNVQQDKSVINAKLGYVDLPAKGRSALRRLRKCYRAWPEAAMAYLLAPGG